MTCSHIRYDSFYWSYKCRHDRDRIYQYLCNQCLSPLILWVRIPLRRGVLDTTLYDKVYQWLAASRWFSPGTPVSSNNKTDRHDIVGIVVENSVKYHNPNPNLIGQTLIPRNEQWTTVDDVSIWVFLLRIYFYHGGN